MEKKFRRSFIGYSDDQVKNKVDSIKDEYAIVLKSQEREIAHLNQEIQDLEDKIKSAQQEIRVITDLRTEVFRILTDCHLENTSRVYKAMKKAEQISKESREAAIERYQERENLKEELKRLTGEMQSIATNYHNVLEAFRNGR